MPNKKKASSLNRLPTNSLNTMSRQTSLMRGFLLPQFRDVTQGCRW
ncbi:Uncharacterised protein [Vibrio cholerae]|nr:Uncharacterised protein [Vibrio cholerae]CSI53424.1 Uncharacterised protein [Vibrio cholerae]